MIQTSEENSNSGVQRLKRIAVIGCGSLGTQIAIELSSSGNLVIVIDKDPKSFLSIPPHLLEASRVVTAVGDGTQEVSLRQAGVQDVDLLIAATPRESVNLMSGQLARHVMRIPVVVCLVKNSHLLSIYENLGIKTINPDGLLMEAIKDGLD
jgi:trk system potassium uptake protein TrkA|tara:strand:+ start:865 stop:1320 length:456 start_codon:yes stop_codon:yes gene_type:complete